MRSVAELAEHARELASAFKVRYAEGATLDTAASAPAFFSKSHHCEYNNLLHEHGFVGEVRVPPIQTEFHYAVVLHELGHCVAPGGVIVPGKDGKRIHNMKLYEEEQAWNWAKHYALEWTTEMEAARQYGLQTYFAEAKQQVRTQIAKTESLGDFLTRRKK